MLKVGHTWPRGSVLDAARHFEKLVHYYGKLDSDERQSQSTSKPPKKIKLLPWVEKYRPKQLLVKLMW
ncbi:hypothetical protein Trydic_g5183 [Trypoxylus dichotomus]